MTYGPKTRLSPHFLLGEFTCKDGTPVPDEAVPALRYLCIHVLEPLRDRFGPVTVVSGHRTTTHNRRVGGASRSRHLHAKYPTTPAADVRPARGTPADWYAWLDLRIAGGLGRYATHVHVDLRGRRARWSG